MRVHVDLDKCDSNALCVLVAPEVFHLDQDGVLRYYNNPDESLLSDIEDAAASCPVQAISMGARLASEPTASGAGQTGATTPGTEKVNWS